MDSGEHTPWGDTALVGRQVRRWRESAGLSQERLAMKCGLSVRTIRNLEMGRGRPRWATLDRLLEALPLDEQTRVQVERARTHRAAQQHPAPSDAEGAGPMVRAPAQLPGDVFAFTGRESHLTELESVLAPTAPDEVSTSPQHGPGVAIAAIVGMAGVGKTSLAVHWAHRARANWPHGQLFVDLRGYDPQSPVDAMDALAHLLRALDVPEQDWPLTVHERAARYRSEVAQRRVLVLLDNAGSAEQVRPLLPGSPGCAVIITSRDVLGGLVAREGVRRILLDPLTSVEAVRLLRRLVDQRGADTDDLGALADLCDRLPLALRVAAELVQRRPETTVAALVEDLRSHQARLSRLRQPTDQRADLSAVFSWSLLHLAARDAHAFARLGLYPGPTFDRYVLAALADTTIEAAADSLEALSDAHLVYSVEGGRYGIHDLLREYARSLIAGEAGQRTDSAAVQRLMAYLLTTSATAARRLYPAGSAEPDIDPPPVAMPPLQEPSQCLDWLCAEEDNLCAVVARYGREQPRETIALSTALYRYLVAGHTRIALKIHGCALDAAELLDDRASMVQCLNSLGTAYLQYGSPERARDLFLRALDVARGAHDGPGEARALLCLGYGEPRVSVSIEYFTQALERYRRLGDHDGQTRCLSNLGFALERLDRLDDAAACLAEAADMARSGADRALEANVHGGLGDLARKRGDHEAALDHHEQALGVFNDLGDRSRAAWALNSIGADLHQTGDVQRSTTTYRLALETFEAIEDPTGQLHALNGLAAALLDRQEASKAYDCFSQALLVAETLADRHQAARAHAGMMTVLERIGRRDQAIRHGELAWSIYREMGQPEAEVIHQRLISMNTPTT